MINLIATIIIGISLSMDAFSLALIYGTCNISKKDKIILSLIVGIYHFIMPLIGLFCGNIVLKYLIVSPSLLVMIIFFIIGAEMIFSSIKNKQEKVVVSIIGFLFFGLSVSIDSLTTGIGLKAINDNYIQVALVFAIVSSLFTYVGLFLGNKLKEILGKVATFIGGVILIILGISYFF